MHSYFCAESRLLNLHYNHFQGFSRDKIKVDKVLHFHYLICMLLPILKQINHDHNIELQIEAKIKGGHSGSAYWSSAINFHVDNFVVEFPQVVFISDALQSITGQKPAEVGIQQAEIGCTKQCCWYVLCC